MAIRGRKPTATIIRLITGNPGKRAMLRTEPMLAGAIERPDKLSVSAGRLWDRFIGRSFWLTWADGPKARMWCYLQAEFERSPAKMQSSRIAQLRALGSELGFDPGSRARLGASASTSVAADPVAKYLK